MVLAARGAADFHRLAVEGQCGGVVPYRLVFPGQGIQSLDVAGMGFAPPSAEELQGVTEQGQCGGVVPHRLVHPSQAGQARRVIEMGLAELRASELRGALSQRKGFFPSALNH
jgi:hypothetical protein